MNIKYRTAMAEANIETLKAARPYMRSALAFIIWMKTGDTSLEISYLTADHFLNTLQKDVIEQAPLHVRPKPRP